MHGHITKPAKKIILPDRELDMPSNGIPAPDYFIGKIEN